VRVLGGIVVVLILAVTASSPALAATGSVNTSIAAVHRASVARRFHWADPRNAAHTATGVPSAAIGCRRTSASRFRCSFRSGSGKFTSVYGVTVTYFHGKTSVGAIQHTKTEQDHAAEEAEIKRLAEELNKALGSGEKAAEEKIQQELTKREAEARQAEADLKKAEEELNKALA
jgi:hypothetical protein